MVLEEKKQKNWQGSNMYTQHEKDIRYVSSLQSAYYKKYSYMNPYLGFSLFLDVMGDSMQLHGIEHPYLIFQ